MRKEVKNFPISFVKMYKYCGVKFARGTGLGNRLFPWARAIVFARNNNTSIIWPYWFHFRKASFLKGGIDYRTSLGKILLYKNFKNNGSYLSYYKKALTVLSNKKEINWFSGDGAFFSDLHDFQPLIKEELFKIAHPKVLSDLKEVEVPKIILNIRRGKDFSDAKVPEDFINKGGLRTPLSWFFLSLSQIREHAGQDIPALIISDGNSSDLAEILSLPGVSLAKTKTAIADLLLLSKAKIILGSGGSSFTAWGSFLSKATTLTIPGQSLQWFNISNNQTNHLVTTYDPNAPNSDLLKLINEKL